MLSLPMVREIHNFMIFQHLMAIILILRFRPFSYVRTSLIYYYDKPFKGGLSNNMKGGIISITL